MPNDRDPYPLWLFLLGVGAFILILILIAACAERHLFPKAAGHDAVQRIVDERHGYYATYAHHDHGYEGCRSVTGRSWRWEVWWAIRDVGIGPLVTHRSGRTWLGAVCCTLWHESRLKPDAVSPAHLNSTGKSDFGIAQFNAEWTPPALALDPHWSIRTMVRMWTAGLEHRWNAYPKCIRPA